jgi:hypothetical protein
MTTCNFSFKDNQITTIDGADAGTYLITDNYADILISGVTYHKCPFDRRIAKNNADGTITMEVA